MVYTFVKAFVDVMNSSKEDSWGNFEGLFLETDVGKKLMQAHSEAGENLSLVLSESRKKEVLSEAGNRFALCTVILEHVIFVIC